MRQMQRARVLRVLHLIDTEKARHARGRIIMISAEEAITQRGYFIGTCGEDGAPTYPMQFDFYKVSDGKVSGWIYWPTRGESRSKFKGTIDDNRLLITEHDLLKGSGIKVPVHYRGVLVGNAFTGCWYTKEKQTSFQAFTNLHIYK